MHLYTHEYFFPPYRVDVTLGDAGADGASGEELVEVWQTFRGNEWSNKGSKFGEGQEMLTVELRPLSKKNFYETRGGCKSLITGYPICYAIMWNNSDTDHTIAVNIIGFLKSPMILMALVSCGMIFGLPYMMENSKCSHHHIP